LRPRDPVFPERGGSSEILIFDGRCFAAENRQLGRPPADVREHVHAKSPFRASACAMLIVKDRKADLMRVLAILSSAAWITLSSAAAMAQAEVPAAPVAQARARFGK
jgi:hypothetical protein